MAAPTNAANVKKALANSEPSTHDPTQTYARRAFRGQLSGVYKSGKLYWLAASGTGDVK